ncbi:MAG: hypothetical protein ACYSW0_03865 [Planctomycetota bacterium]|jgi:hypothetical protein
MPAATGDDSILFDEIDFFSNQIGPAVPGPEVPDIADQKGPNRSAVNSLLGVSRRIIGLFDTLCDPLNPTASFVPVFLQKRRRARIRNDGVDTVLFAYLERFKYLLIGEVVLEQLILSGPILPAGRPFAKSEDDLFGLFIAASSAFSSRLNAEVTAVEPTTAFFRNARRFTCSFIFSKSP